MNHQFRPRLTAGELLVGTLVTLPAPAIAEILADLGFDWLFVDTEHGPFDALETQALLQAAGSRYPCLVRVPAGEEVWIKKALDVGATGVIVPQVNSVEEAERVVRLCKYPPEGTRGVGLARTHGYGSRFQEYVAVANQVVTVVIQIEHADALEDVGAIVSVPGIDAVLIGPYDLSASLGRMGQVDHPEVLDAIAQIRAACLAAGVRLGAFGVDAGAVQPFIEQGFSLIAVGTDALFLMQAAREALAAIESARNPRSLS
jgi:2-dehydro-3-deoxyglucarate aldolase/4-hydroxy-2-oxoheptanedioate aldolase